MIGNVTGWNELITGNILMSVFTLYDTALVGWSVVILFFAFQIMLYIKSQNVTLSWVSGLFFASLFAVSTFVKTVSVQMMYLMLVIELAGIIFMFFMKK